MFFVVATCLLINLLCGVVGLLLINFLNWIDRRSDCSLVEYYLNVFGNVTLNAYLAGTIGLLLFGVGALAVGVFGLILGLVEFLVNSVTENSIMKMKASQFISLMKKKYR